MQQAIRTMAMLAVCVSTYPATAADKVVVIPLLESSSQPKVEIPVVTSAGRTWMALNLGASQVATSSADPAAYGTLYQWGRLGDGHEYRSSPTTTQQSSTDEPGHGRFIKGFCDWRNPSNETLWQGASGINNPCPAGFRLPTAAEWEVERASWGTNNSDGAFNSPLKLVMAGYRKYPDANLDLVGSYGYYWSSTGGWGASLPFLFYSSGAGMLNHYVCRAFGFSVRCIKD